MQPGAGGGLIPLVPIPLNYAVMFVAHHRWLGPVWPADLAFRLVLAQRLGVASGIVAQFAGHAARRPSLVVSPGINQRCIRCFLLEDGCMHW